MSWELVSALLGIAVVDSINPSALAMTTYLVATPGPPRRVPAYIAAIFLTYFALGTFVVLVLGDGVRALVDALDRPGVGFALSGLVGLAGLAVAVRPRRRRARAEARPQPVVATSTQAFVLGVTITAVESTTALPYLGALSLVVRADLAVGQQLAVLAGYCAVFVAPPAVLAAAARMRRTAPTDRFGTVRAALRSRRGDLIVRTLCAIVGVALVVDAALFFVRGDALF